MIFPFLANHYDVFCYSKMSLPEPWHYNKLREDNDQGRISVDPHLRARNKLPTNN